MNAHSCRAPFADSLQLVWHERLCGHARRQAATNVSAVERQREAIMRSGVVVDAAEDATRPAMATIIIRLE